MSTSAVGTRNRTVNDVDELRRGDNRTSSQDRSSDSTGISILAIFAKQFDETALIDAVEKF